MTDNQPAPPVARGHIKLARRIFESDLWRTPRVFSRFEAWVDLLQLAAWRPYAYVTRSFGNIDLERGELVAAVRPLAERWQWHKNAVHHFLSTLEKTGRIEGRKQGRYGTLYRIVNYDTYQSDGRAIGTQTGTQTGTEAGRKRDKRETDKAITTTTPTPPAASWVTRLTAVFNEKGGSVREGHLGRVLKPAYEKYGEAILRSAIGLWLSERKAHGWSCAFPKFGADHVRWCEDAIALHAAVDSGVDYWDNEALQRLTRPTLVA